MGEQEIDRGVGMRAARWFIAMLGAFAAFILPLWAWHALNLPPQGANQLSVALGAAAVVSAVVGAPLFWWAGLDSDTARPWDLIATRTSDGWLEDVQAKMRSIWVTEGLGRSLEVVAAIELGFTERPDAVAVPMRNATPNAPATVFPIGTSLLSIFESDKAGRRLLLLGQPGSGKTTLLLHLGQTMLDRVASHAQAPTPIYLSLSAGEWKDIHHNSALQDAEEDGGRSIKWLADQISKHYQVPRRRVIEWLRSDPSPIILLLDGLDEIQDRGDRLNCVRTLSRARITTNAGLVVACRTHDYREIGEPLNFGSAVEIMPLRSSDIDEYLSTAQADLGSLREAVANDQVLKQLLDTPLMLNIAAITYKGRLVDADLLVGSIARRRDQLWRTYISAMLERRRSPQDSHMGNPIFPPHSTMRTLRFLAGAMERKGWIAFNPYYIDRSWLPVRWNRTLLALSGIRALILMAILALGIIKFDDQGGSSLLPRVIGVTFGCGSFIIGTLVSVRHTARVSGGWRQNIRFALSTVFIAEGCGLAAAILLMLGGSIVVVFGILWGLYGGLILAAIFTWQPFESQGKARIAPSPCFLMVARITTLAVCTLSAYWLVWAAHEHHVSYYSPLVSVALMSCVGLAVAAAFVSFELFIDHYLSRLIASSLKLIPFRVNSFLAHVDERILMRRVGPQYRFLHLTLRRHLSGSQVLTEMQTVVLSTTSAIPTHVTDTQVPLTARPTQISNLGPGQFRAALSEPISHLVWHGYWDVPW
jgi:energy-coupling factor transporter ATP-binding protein EcfA2